MPMYLVSMNLRRTDPLLPVDQLVKFVRDAFLPSAEALTRLQAQGKVISGGYPIGGRPAIMLLMDASSEKELYEMLEGLPVWEQVEVEVRRMQAFEDLEELDETS
jgi:muconolactone delta-isomerase